MDWKTLFRPADLEKLIANWKEQEPLRGTSKEQDFQPVCRIYDPYGSAEWLVTELDPENSLAFGWADLGLGMGELGYFCVEEIASMMIVGTRRMMLDFGFVARKTLSEYAAEYRAYGSIKA